MVHFRQIIETATLYGVRVESVHVMVDQKTGRPAGSAQLHLQPFEENENDPLLTAETYVLDAIDRLNDEDFRGRPARVRRFETRSRPSVGGSGTSRYFGGDISIKCSNCNQVGHRQNECPQEPALPPCYFCAGTDHAPRKSSLKI